MSVDHYRKLERMYVNAPVSRWYGISAAIDEGRAEVRLPVKAEFLHAAHAVHGSVFFRMLDDAAFFAVNSLVPDVFVLTVSFTVQLARPATGGTLRAEGRVLHRGGRIFHAASDLFDEAGERLGSGTGIFSRSAIALDERVGYV